MNKSTRFHPHRRTAAFIGVLVAGLFAGRPAISVAQLPLPMTLRDFQVPGSQVGDLSPGSFISSDNCRDCHGKSARRNAIVLPDGVRQCHVCRISM